MAQPEPRPWYEAALGGVLLALGGALFGAARLGKAPPAPAQRATSPRRKARTGGVKASGPSDAKPRARTDRAKVRTKPKVVEPPARSLHWPPPPPPPISPNGEGMQAGEGTRDDTPLPVDARSETLGYEVADTRVATLVTIMATGVAAILASIIGLFVFIGQAHRADRASTPLTPQQLAVIVPPGPRLQDHPLHDIAAERKREDDLLNAYAWTDRDRGAARIPLARASALVIGRPLDPLPAARP